jgi:hypothetical protein
MIRDRLPTAIVACACGAASGIGGLVTWITAHNGRPRLGMDHTSFSKMLVYRFVAEHSFMRSVGFVVLLLGAVMVIGALSGLRVLTVLGAVLSLALAGMWIGLTVHDYNTPHLANSYYLNPVHLPWSSLREGAWLTIGGALVGILSSLVLRGWNAVSGRAIRSTGVGVRAPDAPTSLDAEQCTQ